MCTSAFDRLIGGAGLCLLLSTAGCEIEAPEFRFGDQITSDTFNLYSDRVGILVVTVESGGGFGLNEDILEDPNNPFRNNPPSLQTRFDILASGGPVASFYAFGTTLVTQPTGENQFYTSRSLEQIYDLELAPADQLPDIRSQAIFGYQTILTIFPESVSFLDASATTFFRVPTEAYFGLQRLGGDIPPNWTLIETANEGLQAVRL